MRRDSVGALGQYGHVKYDNQTAKLSSATADKDIHKQSYLGSGIDEDDEDDALLNGKSRHEINQTILKLQAQIIARGEGSGMSEAEQQYMKGVKPKKN